MRLTSLTYDEWIRLIFDHPGEGPEWHWGNDVPYWDGPPAVTLAYLTRLFDAPLAVLDGFSDAQINRGMWYVLGATGENYPVVLTDPALPLENRVHCVRAMTNLFRDLFATYCTPHLSHRSEEGSPLNSACYMWWDIITFGPSPGAPQQRPVDEAALDVMRLTLAMDSIACQESALHGLGHWHHAYPAEIEGIIDPFVERQRNGRPELLTYAHSARCGCVQ